MGQDQSKPRPSKHDHHLKVGTFRGQAITGGTLGKNTLTRTRPANARSIEEEDYGFVIHALGKLLLFSKTDSSLVKTVVMGMWERDVEAGKYFPHLLFSRPDQHSVVVSLVGR
jgi:hypothetical protein